MWDLFRLIFGLIIDLFRSRAALEPKSWCSNSRSSCCDGASQFGCYFLAGDRVVLGWACHLFPKARGALAIVRPDTVWHCAGFRLFWSSRPSSGAKRSDN